MTYTPAPDYSGPDSFTVTASDAVSTSVPATVSVTVTPVNDAPVVVGASVRTTVGSPVSVTLPASDVDGDPVAITGVSAPGRGSATFSGTTVTYRPTRAGSDLFTVTVSDGQGGTGTAQVGVAVAKAAPTLALSAGKLKAGKKGKLKVQVTGVPGIPAAGTVTLKVAGKKYTANVVNGVATLKTAKLPDKAKLKVKATYSGDGQYLGAGATQTFPVKQPK